MSRRRAPASSTAGTSSSQRETLDAVWVATPPLCHRAPAVAAMERGLPVYLEKPIARTLDDARAIAAAAEAAGVVCAIGYQWHAAEALELLRAAVGDQQVAYLWGVSAGPTAARPWFLERSGGGGNLLERGSHQLDLQRAVAGDVSSVQVATATALLAQSEIEGGDIEDAATITLRFASGALGTVLLAWTRPGQPGSYSLDVLAPDATLRIELDPTFTLTGQAGGRRLEEDDDRASVRTVRGAVLRGGAGRGSGRGLLHAARRDRDARHRARVRAIGCSKAGASSS